MFVGSCVSQLTKISKEQFTHEKDENRLNTWSLII